MPTESTGRVPQESPGQPLGLRPTSRLEVLVREFDRDAAESRRMMRTLLTEDAEAFYRDAIEALQSVEDSRAFQFLCGLLVAENMLLRALCDPALDFQRALSLARLALHVDPTADITLARRVADAAVEGNLPVHTGAAARLLVILEAVSTGHRIAGSLGRLLRHENAWVRSKAVLMIARSRQSSTWARRRLEDADPRIRANAIEGLWGLDTGDAREVLVLAAGDRHNRVRGNALLGLYKLGDCSVIPEVIELASHQVAAFRSTAAWLMGMSRDPRFTEMVGRMVSDSNSAVRKRAFIALRELKNAAGEANQSGIWRVTAIPVKSEIEDAPQILRVSVTDDSVNRPPALLPTHFHVSQRGLPVWHYRVSERPLQDLMSLVFLRPTSKELSRRIWDLAVQRCLPRKRVQDLWGSLSYTTLPDHPGTEAWVEEPIELTTNPEIVGSVLSSGQPSLMHPDLWNALWSALRPDARPGMRNVIAYCRRPLTGGAGTALIASARASRGLVQVVSFGPNPALRSFCRDTKALLHEIADEEELPDALEQACLNLLARYEISFSPVTAPPGPIRVRIHSPCGYGEVNVPQGI